MTQRNQNQNQEPAQASSDAVRGKGRRAAGFVLIAMLAALASGCGDDVPPVEVMQEATQQRQDSKEWGQRKGGLDLQAALAAQQERNDE